MTGDDIKPQHVVIKRISNMGTMKEGVHFWTFPVGWGHVRVVPGYWNVGVRGMYYPDGSTLPDGSVVDTGHFGTILPIGENDNV